VTGPLVLLGSVVLGLLVGWLAAVIWTRSRAEREQAGGRQRIGELEGVVGELRGQLQERDAQVAGLRQELDAARQARVAAETRLEEAQKNLAEQRRLLNEAQERLKEVFTTLSTEVLRSNAEEFAKKTAEKVRPLSEALQRYEAELKRLERVRQQAYGSLREQLEQIAKTHRELAQQTTTLSTALRSPQVKGRWGEITLRNAVELAGMSRYCDFVEQSPTDDASSRRKPDLVVRLPGGRRIVIDAKTPISAYLDAMQAASEEERRECLRRHAADMRQTLRELSHKAYWDEFAESVDFVVMFVPGESFFSAALEQDGGLMEEGFRNRVLLASPTTLIAILRCVALSWQQQELVENAKRIGEAAQLLYERVCKFGEHLGKVGLNLKRAVEAYNEAVGSWEHRVLPMSSRIDELGVRVRNAEQMELPAVDTTVRSLPTEEVGRLPGSQSEAPHRLTEGSEPSV